LAAEQAQVMAAFAAAEQAKLAEAAARAAAEQEKAERVALAQRVVDAAQNEVNVASNNLKSVHDNQYEYKSNVEVRTTHRRRVLGVTVSPSYSFTTVAEYDAAKYQAAVADAQRILSERQHQLQNAVRDLRIAKSG